MKPVKCQKQIEPQMQVVHMQTPWWCLVERIHPGCQFLKSAPKMLLSFGKNIHSTFKNIGMYSYTCPHAEKALICPATHVNVDSDFKFSNGFMMPTI